MFETRDQKKILNTSLLFSESDLRLSDVKTVSRLAHIGLAYHASWGVRVAYPRSGEHLGHREPEYWGKQSWTFETRNFKNFLITILCFSESALRLSDVKTASRLIHIGLAYHASWGVRVADPRSGGARLGNSEPESWGNKTAINSSPFSDSTSSLLYNGAPVSGSLTWRK